MNPDSPELWTIGHWVCSEQAFLAALLGAEIDVLADVRAQPGSRRSPQFSKDAMPTWLAAAQIDYVHLPGLAGRRPKQPGILPELNAGWRNQSFKNYADYTLTAPYADGLAELMDLASDRRVCIMCGEPMPWRCHRSLIANSLTARGWTVWHLSTSAAPRRHQLGAWGAEPVVAEDGTIVYPPV
ncbi:DUF488 domain-containing protein [Granulicoccus sp. GXG6511]|uniref:DUF488 domain-containing protein n=1 Tax=Granulicoccus sp. GXG6511 TaxID=3381351 RepID=UPI003D7CC959